MVAIMVPRAAERPTTPDRRLLDALGMRCTAGRISPEALPCVAEDATAGSENELQAVVLGPRDSVDLPLAIENSRYYANVRRRAQVGDVTHRSIREIEEYLSSNRDQVWENSWIRVPKRRLGRTALRTFHSDILANKANGSPELRSDAGRFFTSFGGDECIRFPVSYLPKLALAELLGGEIGMPWSLRQTGYAAMERFSNDNSSPETSSLYLIENAASGRLGSAVAEEAALRYLLMDSLVTWSSLQFDLAASGQQPRICFAPHPPLRQKELNQSISDAFYRELFVSPCLSGWEVGEKKRDYMHLCHQVLSRSQLNVIPKLREAGIVNYDVVTLPSTSNVSLANNGTHVSLGSRRLTQARRMGGELSAAAEKQISDLVIKISEHFLPLFVDTYSAAPYRLDFTDFHPERILGFLPHELDYTHLRMLWRLWKVKADLGFLGQRLTPYGPRPLDQLLKMVLRLRGDFIHDLRLIDYPVAWLATPHSSALDGDVGNVERLKEDLEALGVSDRKLALYIPFRAREFNVHGYVGVEGRHYSLFPSFVEDMDKAVMLQQVIVAAAYRYALAGEWRHQDIPDDPTSESERRFPFFAAAIGLPKFYVNSKTTNQFLRHMLRRVAGIRPSLRYSGYLHVPRAAYLTALLETLEAENADIVAACGAVECLQDLRERLQDDSRRASRRLVRGILSYDRTPLKLPARDFNLKAETYYRGELRRRQLEEALGYLRKAVAAEKSCGSNSDFDAQVQHGARVQDPIRFLESVSRSLPLDEANAHDLRAVILLILAIVGTRTEMQRGAH